MLSLYLGILSFDTILVERIYDIPRSGAGTAVNKESV